jgi:hypothetical protein
MPVTKEGRRPKPTPLCRMQNKDRYIFFSEHVLVAASHTPPALAQSAAVFAVFTSWAKAGTVKVSARASAKIEIIVFMAFTPLRWTESPIVKPASRAYVPGTRAVSSDQVFPNALHALKYGALSNGSGHVSVTWNQLSQPSLVKLVWRESGGPEVGPPERKGFGSHLIERAFGGQLGMAQLVLNPESLCCVLEIGSDHAGDQ